nr:uncharacterized protein LOC119718713 isoform X4 [Anas platyrhynchos]
MAQGNAVKNLREEATCAVCLDFFRRPVMLLPCGHNFCRSCVARCAQKSQDGAGSCPLCRLPFPPGGFCPNRQLANVVAAVRELVEGEDLCLGGDLERRVPPAEPLEDREPTPSSSRPQEHLGPPQNKRQEDERAATLLTPPGGASRRCWHEWRPRGKNCWRCWGGCGGSWASRNRGYWPAWATCSGGWRKPRAGKAVEIHGTPESPPAARSRGRGRWSLKRSSRTSPKKTTPWKRWWRGSKMSWLAPWRKTWGGTRKRTSPWTRPPLTPKSWCPRTAAAPGGAKPLGTLLRGARSVSRLFGAFWAARVSPQDGTVGRWRCHRDPTGLWGWLGNSCPARDVSG